MSKKFKMQKSKFKMTIQNSKRISLPHLNPPPPTYVGGGGNRRGWAF